MWAGGKSKLIKHYEKVWPAGQFSSYVEPFFGGGAVYAWQKTLNPALSATVGDVNPELVKILNEVASSFDPFLEEVKRLVADYLALPEDKAVRKAHYYDLRRQYWLSKGSDSALLYVLMRLGFNGIWQTCKESEGLFGTPAGLLHHTRTEQVFREDTLREWHRMLKTSSIQAASYEALQFNPEGSLIYLDPPYRDSFTTYGTVFGDEEQRKLVEWVRSQREAGATVLLANRCVDGDLFFEDLLSDADFHYFDVVYTAGRRKRTEAGFEAKPAREFLAVVKP